jgi:hypothetical protein
VRGPRPTLRPEPRVTVEPTIGRRRHCAEAVELAKSGEADFARFVRDVEAHPLFVALRERGHIAKVGLRGRIPRGRYDAYLDAEMIRLIQDKGISDRPGWFAELSSPEALRQPTPYAKRYGVTVDEVRRIARYLRRLGRDDDAHFAAELDEERTADHRAATADTPAAAGSGTDPAALCAAFVARYGVAQEDFVAAFIEGELDPAELCARYGAPRAEVLRVLAAVRDVQIYEAFAESAAAPDAPEAHARAAERQLVATVERDVTTGVPRLQLEAESVYAETYRLSRQGVSALYELASDRRQAEDLLTQLRLVNQRKSLLCRLVSAVFEWQFRHFATGREADLRPLSQADLARRIEEDKATVCRIIRDKVLRYSGAERPLTWYCQTRTAVVERILAERPELSDAQVADLLARRHACRIARRTVNYHRAKLCAAPSGPARESEECQP